MDQDQNKNPNSNPSQNQPNQPQQPQQPAYPYQNMQYGRSVGLPQCEPEPKEPPEDIWGGETSTRKGFLGIVSRLLRSREGIFADIRDNKTSVSDTFGMILVSLICFIAYGAVMGLYNPRFFPLQCLYGGLKLPLVFLGTLVVCLPALYVVNVFIGLRLRFLQIINMFMTAVAVTSIVAVCLAPISGFFLLTIKGFGRYQMLYLINVGILSASGLAGLVYLWRAMSFMGRHYEKRVGIRFRGKNVLRLWMLIYIFVGVQLAWELRPFMVKEFSIEPDQPLEFVRSKHYDFYTVFFRAIGQQLDIVRSDAEEIDLRVEMLQVQLDNAVGHKQALEAEIASGKQHARSRQSNQRELLRLEREIKQIEDDLEKVLDARDKFKKQREELQRD